MENQPQQYLQQQDPFFQEDQFQDQGKHLSEYFDVLYKHKTLIFLFFIFVMSLTILITLQTTPVYEATAKLVIDNEKSVSPITGEKTDFESYASQTLTFQTHFKLITSTPVIKQVIRVLNLDKLDQEDLEISIVNKLIKQLKSNIKLLLNQTDTDTGVAWLDPETQKMNQLVKDVQEKISISEVRNTRLLNISVKDIDPKLSAAISNTLAKKYIEFNLSNRMESSQENLEWLNSELYRLKKQLEDDEKAFFEYKQRTKVFSMEGKQKVVDQKIAEFNNKYLDTRNKRLILDSKISELENHLKSAKGLVNVRSLINNDLIESIYTKIIDLEIEYNKLSKVYKPKHPKIVQIKSEMDKSKKRLDDELAKELANLKSERTVLLSGEQVLEKTIEEFEQDALDTSGKELKYTILQRNVNTSQNLYDSIVARVKESDILKTSDTSNIRVVEKAEIPDKPVKPDKKLNLLIGIVIGLFGGAFLAFFLDYLDQTLRTEEDVQNYLGLTVLAVVPEANKAEGYGYGDRK